MGPEKNAFPALTRLAPTARALAACSKTQPQSEPWRLQPLERQHRRRIRRPQMVREGLLLLSIGIAGCIHGAINAPQVPASFKKQQDRPSGFELFMKRIGRTSEKDAIEDEGRQCLQRFPHIQMPGAREHARKDASNPRRFKLWWWCQA